jgi:hypothetical protein
MRLFRVLKTETTEDAKPRPEAATHVKNGVFNHLKLMPIVWVDLHTPLLKVSEIIISAEIQVIIMKFQLCGATQPIQPRDLITVILYQEAKAHASGEEDVDSYQTMKKLLLMMEIQLNKCSIHAQPKRMTSHAKLLPETPTKLNSVRTHSHLDPAALVSVKECGITRSLVKNPTWQTAMERQIHRHVSHILLMENQCASGTMASL